MKISSLKPLLISASVTAVMCSASVSYAEAPALQAIGKIKSGVAEGVCIDVLHARVESGTNVQTYGCKDQAFQSWYFTLDGELRNAANPAYCLDVQLARASSGANVQVWHCNGTSAQRWTYTESGELRSKVGDNFCLDVSGANPEWRTNVQLWQCNGTSAQLWSIPRIPWTQIKYMASPELCLEVKHANTTKGAAVGVWTCNDWRNMQWYLSPKGEIRSAIHGDRCLDVSQGLAYSGNRVQSWECNGTDAQKWLPTPKGEFRSALDSNFCLDLMRADAYAGNQVQLWQCNNTSAQRWLTNSRMDVELRMVDGMYSMVFRSGNRGQALTNPVNILRLVKQMGYDDIAIQNVYDSFNADQRVLVDQELVIDEANTIFELSLTAAPNGYLTEELLFNASVVEVGNAKDGTGAAISSAENVFSFKGDMAEVKGRASLGLASYKHGAVGVNVNGPEVGYVASGSSGGFAIGAGANLAGTSATLGSKEGTHFGLGASKGVGFDGAAKWGQDGQYGLTIGIKAVTLNVYISGDDAEKAAHAVADGVLEGGGWTVVAATDVADWTATAATDIANWSETAVHDVANAIEDAAVDVVREFESAGCTLLSWIGIASCD